MLQLSRSLSFEQRIVFDKIVRFCKEVLRSEKGANIIPNPPQMIVKGKSYNDIQMSYPLYELFFIIGNGGTGKSYLIRTVCKWIEKILGGPGEIKTRVLRLSFAAVAASLIGNIFMV